ncbi:hypothetical protein, partial [Clostridium paraputrificum]|uniref:hypothetical protein n=1 Tax=Clostridium paraputrificum TaxID=29363 RepID=UPI003F5E8D6D
MVDFSTFIDKLNISFPITSLDIFSITYTNNIESFINSMIKKFPNIKISLYLNIEKNFKDFIHINNIFNKLMYISNIDNISLYQTELTEKIIIINKDLANTFSLNTLFKYNNIANNFYRCKPFNLNLLAKIYTIYVSKKVNIFDSEFKYYFNKNNIININPVNVPQFSSLKNACDSAVNEIYKNNNITYIE